MAAQGRTAIIKYRIQVKDLRKEVTRYLCTGGHQIIFFRASTEASFLRFAASSRGGVNDYVLSGDRGKPCSLDSTNPRL